MVERRRLAIEYVPIESLRQHPENANNGDVDAIAESIRVNGLYDALKVQRSTSYILVGNHRWAEMLRRGEREVPVIWLDIDDAAALRILAADNRIGRLGHDDEGQLAQNLHALYETDSGLAGTGYDLTDLTYLLDLMGEPLTEADMAPADVPPAPDNTIDGLGERPDLGFRLIPVVDEDGMCHEVTLVNAGMGTISLDQYQVARRALGLGRIDTDEVAASGVLNWRRR